jgi:hypothetical protein
MKIPLWLIGIPIVFCVFALVGIGYDYLCLRDVADFALILTFIIIFFYTYFTYVLAKEPMLPVASFMLKAYPDNPYEIAFIMQNYSKVPINCWTNLNATIDGQGVSLGGFYSGESSFYIQPFGTGTGHFNIIKMLEKVGRSLDQMKTEAPFKENQKEQLYLKIDFWYSRVGKKDYTHSPPQPHYFDFLKGIMVTDF